MNIPDARDYSKKFSGISDMSIVCNQMIAEGYSRPFMIIFIRILTNANFDEAERLVTDFFEKR
jgi:hypothetical protein